MTKAEKRRREIEAAVKAYHAERKQRAEQLSGARVILSYGMGVDSTEILVRWLTDPSSRDFDLSQLTVVTCMVGNEYPSTYKLVREHILPLLREHGVRFVQVARGGHSERDGIVVLDDSTSPTELFERGPVSYADELRSAVTMQPTCNRQCTLKWKGWVLDRWIESEVGDTPYRHCIGFAVGEESRLVKDQNFGGIGDRFAEYPLFDWNLDRAACIEHIATVTGVAEWQKSCCVYCPFQHRHDAIERWDDEPEAAGEALEIEDIALRFNPRLPLFNKEGTALAAAVEADNQAALDALEARLSSHEWAVYLMRRANDAGQLHTDDCPNHKANRKPRTKKTKCDCPKHETVKGLGANQKRDIREVFAGSRFECEAELRKLAAKHGATVERGCSAQLIAFRDLYPTREAAIVVAPRVYRAKGTKHTKAFETLYAACKAADEAAKAVERKAA